ncbi:MAG: hypothetical protein B6D64_04945 [Bacteroidetes bacterium 4484_276]|nr:MAG: hypothetical protein B6D64_04945 [Bacteroidetes bacterium 4484_276]
MKSNQKVLIAEDSPTQALHLQMILEERGYEVLHGLNGEEAMVLLDENDPPDIIISDIVMPIMDGYEFCSRVKGNDKTREIPFILLTQLSNPDDVIRGLQSGADNFISKPYSEEFLFDRITDIMLNREIRRRSPNLDITMEIYFGGQKYKLNSNRMQILDLLLSTYYNAINKNKELEDKNLELKKLHKELKIRNLQLKKINDEKNKIIGIAAHDLRSPLATISGFFSFISDTIKENSIKNQERVFSTINGMLDYMLNLITDVLDYSKIESGKLDLKKEEFDLVSCLKHHIELNNTLGAQKNITIYFGHSREKLIVFADRNKLKQVMDNLLSNALKYSERNTKVHVYISVLEKEVQVVVNDQGKGIPAKEVGEIFKPFVTTSVKPTAGEKSTGLGLVSVKKIVETHGGRIWVESEVGVGSQFYFTIPYQAKKEGATTDENDLSEAVFEDDVKDLKVLIAEDEETSEMQLSILAEGFAKEILHAKTGADTVEVCRNNPDIDLILMDIRMPVIDGYEATRQIRQFNKDVIIIAQSAVVLGGDHKRATDAGCNDYISKPIKKEIIMEIIKEYF